MERIKDDVLDFIYNHVGELITERTLDDVISHCDKENLPSCSKAQLASYWEDAWNAWLGIREVLPDDIENSDCFDVSESLLRKFDGDENLSAICEKIYPIIKSFCRGLIDNLTPETITSSVDILSMLNKSVNFRLEDIFGTENVILDTDGEDFTVKGFKDEKEDGDGD